MLKAWLRLFRVVNLPTVPGDVLVGASTVLAGAWVPKGAVTPVLAAALASVFVYMFGLADNDIVGAKTDGDRPIPRGEISPTAARVARGLCLVAAAALGMAWRLPLEWWIVAAALVASCWAYNRTKWYVLMGLCRGLDVAAGAAALVPWGTNWPMAAYGAAAAWTAYIAFVTKYSEGEEHDPTRRRTVGILIGAIVYLQLAVLLFYPVRAFLVAGAILLLLLRLAKRLLPEVSAS